jgi:hypothetical protein
MTMTMHHSCHILKKSSSVVNAGLSQPFHEKPAFATASTWQPTGNYAAKVAA